MVRDDDRYVIGVDYGTLSGRALVVRVSDGAELGSAVLEYPHGVVDTVMPGSGRRLPPDWALQVPSDYVEVLRTAVPAAVESAGVDPAARHRHRHRLHRLHDGADPRRRHPAVRHRRAARRAARLRQALEAPRRPGPGRPHHRAGPRARREVAGPLRRRHLLGVGVRQGPAAARGGPRRLRRDGALGRGRRLDRLAAHRHLRAQRLHRRLQGHPPGRRLPVARLPRRPQPGLRGLRRGQARPRDRPARRPSPAT